VRYRPFASLLFLAEFAAEANMARGQTISYSLEMTAVGTGAGNCREPAPLEKKRSR
jgi:hypothetical protein